MQLRLNGLCAHFNFHKIWIIFTMIFFFKTQDILPWTHSRVKARHGLTPLIALPWAGVKGEGVAGRLGPQAVSRELVQTTVRAGKGGWRVSRREPSEFPASFGIHLPLSLCSLFLNLKDEGSILSSDTTNFFSSCISMNYCFIEKYFLNCCCLYKKIESGYASCETES